MVNILNTKKGQITIFMILGLVILMTFSMLYLTARTQPIEQAYTHKQEQAINQLQSRTVNLYVSSCLRNASRDGLYLLGRQGGIIYEEQPGSIMKENQYVKITDRGQELTYLILPKKGREGPPNYPCAGSCTFAMNKKIFDKVRGYTFGKPLTLPSLKKEVPTPGGGLKKVPNSLQEQLESYIAVQTVACVDIESLTQLPELTGATLTAKDIQVQVTFAEDQVFVEANYPLSVALKGETPISFLWNFNTFLPVRFKFIYNAVQDMIEKDRVFLDYDIVIDTQAGVYNSSSYDVEYRLPFDKLRPDAFIERIPLEFRPEDDLIILNDTASILDNEPYIFQFVRRNRRPVLDYKADPADNIVFMIFRATDPDEDNITYFLENAPDDIPPGELTLDKKGRLTLPDTIPETTIIIINATDGLIEDYQELKIKERRGSPTQ